MGLFPIQLITLLQSATMSKIKKKKKKEKKVDLYDLAKVIELYAATNNTFVTIADLKKRNYQLEIYFEYGRK